jgi:hypothetical protein
MRRLDDMLLGLLAPGSEEEDDNGISPVSGEIDPFSPDTGQAECRRLLSYQFVLSRGTISACTSGGARRAGLDQCREHEERNEQHGESRFHGITSLERKTRFISPPPAPG